jgi:hypothetical protein
MNEYKAKSPGRFWHDLYQALALSMVRSGCWGGQQGPIYAELLRMLHSGRPGSLELAVLQIPYVYSCHQGSIDGVDCPDALVVSDLEACLNELQVHGLKGIAFLIDEADCLGTNVPLLQMFRNVFQIVERCSLVLAGTEAVFPALSEVFSPIPRQFHRLDVKPFSSIMGTMELVVRPLADGLAGVVGPQWDTLSELHELCGGAPDELQLYCHHMYRLTEAKTSTRMELSPQVFRDVLLAYRSNTPANLDVVLNSIERLPDALLYKSKWLSRRGLSLEDNVAVTVFARELGNGCILSPEDRTALTSEVSAGYAALFDLGISESATRIKLTGAPLTAGFWKSFVNVERRERWSWDDRSFPEHVLTAAARALEKTCNMSNGFALRSGDSARRALENIRDGAQVEPVDDSMGDMIFAATLAQETKSIHAIDVTIQVDSIVGRQTTCYRFVEGADGQASIELIEAWLKEIGIVLATNKISVEIFDFSRWLLPTANELHRLARHSDYIVPKMFGPDGPTRAVAKFSDGDIVGAVTEFAQLLEDLEEHDVRNNLAYCQILLGEFDAAVSNLDIALSTEYSPLYEFNLGVALFLQGKTDEGKRALSNAIQVLQAPDGAFDRSGAISVLVLGLEGKQVGYLTDVAIDAAILVNLCRMGELSESEMIARVTHLYPDRAVDLLARTGHFPCS